MSRWNKQRDTGWDRTNKNILGERKPTRGSVYSWIEAMKGIFGRCSKKTAVKVNTKPYCVTARMKETCYEFSQCTTHVLLWLSCILELHTIVTVVSFHRLKINHDSHESILESGTVMNTSHDYALSFFLFFAGVFSWGRGWGSGSGSSHLYFVQYYLSECLQCLVKPSLEVNQCFLLLTADVP
jgi:hypothetical protein